MAVNLAKITASLELQTAKYMQGMDAANKRLAKFSSSQKSLLGGIAGAIAGISFANLIKGSIDAADRLNDLSKQTGLSVESLSQLNYAAQQSGTDIEGLNTGLRKLAKTSAEAAGGSKEAAEGFKDLGLSAQNADGSLKDTDTLLLEIAEQFSQYEDGAAKAAVAQKLFGRSGADLIPFLNEGKDGIQALREEADRLGITMSTETAKAADDFNDAIARSKAQVVGFIASAIGPLLPNLTAAVSAFSDTASGAKDLSAATVGLQAGLKTLVSVGLGVAQAFRVIGKGLGGLAGAAVAVANGEFRQAYDVLKTMGEDQVDSMSSFFSAIEKTWSDGSTAVVTTVQEADKKIKKTLMLGGDSKGADDALKALEQFNQTRLSNIKRLMDESDEILTDFLDRDDAALSALVTFTDSKMAEVKRLMDDSADILKEEIKGVNEFEVQLARNSQDIIADTLVNGFKGGAKGIIQSFGDMLLQLSAQAVAADIGAKIFGKDGGGGGFLDSIKGWLSGGGSSGGSSGGGGFLSAIGGFFSKFGGSMDSGGRGQPGMAYAIGTGAQPEMFIPDRPGTFVPAGKGGNQVTQNFYIDAPTPALARQTALQAGAAASRGLGAANARGN